MATPLLDYSFSRPDPKQIVAQGFKGVLRYLAPASNGAKVLGAAERDALRGVGLAIGLVWEWYAQRANEGHAAGVADGQAALNLANSLGVPEGVPIFFAVDWDATPEQQVNINDYLNGAKTALGDRVGIYGGYWPLKRAFDAGVVKWGWQTYAWSGGNWDNRAQLRQTENGQWSGQVDFDEDENGLSGLWLAGVPTASAPVAPASAPAPTNFTTYTIQSGDTFWALEAHNGWTHGELENLNPTVNPSDLQIGEVIKVPASGNHPAPQAAPVSNQYAIRSGDTFWGLETANNWPHGTLQGLNPGVNPTTLRIGQEINIPGTHEAPVAQHTYRTYTVVKDDTLSGIAAREGTSWEVLQQINHIPNANEIMPGEVLRLP